MPNPSKKKYTTPRVPIQTPMFDGPAAKDLGNVTRTWIIFWERLWRPALDFMAEKKATFGLNKALAVENDLTLHYISRTSGTFKDLRIKCKTAPTGQAARLQIQKSTDEGDTWATIFADPGYVELPAGDDSLLEYAPTEDDPLFAAGEAGTIAVDDLLRINCLRAGSVDAGKGIEVVLKWE
jgi:hypothetical protein